MSYEDVALSGTDEHPKLRPSALSWSWPHRLLYHTVYVTVLNGSVVARLLSADHHHRQPEASLNIFGDETRFHDT